jgi:hypothetical protein
MLLPIRIHFLIPEAPAAGPGDADKVLQSLVPFVPAMNSPTLLSTLSIWRTG